MKLLPKSEINKKKGQERQQEIAEGMKLAKRVDGLREVASTEEASLKKFRVETLANIAMETKTAEVKRDSVLLEVEDLEKRRADALIPLENERLQLKDEREKLLVLDLGLKEKDHFLDEKDLALTTRESMIKYQEGQTEQRSQLASQFLTDAANSKFEAENTLRLARKKAEEIDRDVLIKVANLTIREGAVEERETNAFAKEEELRKKEIALAKEWSLLQDRKEMFIKAKKHD